MFGLLARDANLESIPSERFAKASPWAIFGCVGGSYLAYPRREYPASGTVRSQCFLVIVEHLYSMPQACSPTEEISDVPS